MKSPVFTGACTALVTPFLNDKVNIPLALQLIRRQIESGIHTIVLAGTTGESPTLTDTEKIELFNQCKSYVGNECTIIAGTGSNSTVHAVELSRHAEKAGADALLVVSPYYNKATVEGLYVHYETIAQSVNIPVILYNVPSRTGVDIPVSVYKRLSTISNIVGVKEASGNISKIAQIKAQCPEDFYIWSGNDDQTVPIMALGGQGLISVVSNICPTETAAMCDAALQGNYVAATKIQLQLLPLIDLLFSEVNPVPVKEAMRRINYDCGNCRLPLTGLSKDNLLRMDTFFS